MRFWVLLVIIFMMYAGLYSGSVYAVDGAADLSDKVAAISPDEGSLEILGAGLREDSRKRWFSDLFREHVFFTGYAKNESAFRYNSPAAFTKIMNIAQIEPRANLTSSLSFYGRLYGYYEGVHDLETIDTVSVRKGPRNILGDALSPAEVDALELENVRNVEIKKSDLIFQEYYAEYNFYNLDLRIGRQIVRWGVVEGSRVTDEINPLDFSEMILRDIDDRYIPLKMAKADLYAGDTTLELLYIPELTFHKPAPEGTGWEQFQLFEGLEKPEKSAKNSEYALKVTQYVGNYTIHGSYFYSWDDFPTSFRTITGLGQFGVSPTISFRQRYKRTRTAGLAFSGKLFNIVLNGEFAHVSGKYFGTSFGGFDSENPIIEGGAVKRDYLKYALGIDFLLFGADTAVQVIQQYIPDYMEDLIPEKLETVVGFSIRKKIRYETMFPSLLIIYFQNDNDIIFRPRIDYAVWDNLQISVGADIFEGSIAEESRGRTLPGEFHFAGFFDNNDRIYMEAKFLF